MSAESDPSIRSPVSCNTWTSNARVKRKVLRRLITAGGLGAGILTGAVRRGRRRLAGRSRRGRNAGAPTGRRVTRLAAAGWPTSRRRLSRAAAIGVRPIG